MMADTMYSHETIPNPNRYETLPDYQSFRFVRLQPGSGNDEIRVELEIRAINHEPGVHTQLTSAEDGRNKQYLEHFISFEYVMW